MILFNRDIIDRGSVRAGGREHPARTRDVLRVIDVIASVYS